MSAAINTTFKIASLGAQRRLAESSGALQKSMARLSSGLRINSAGDDAAGLAVSQTLSADAKVFRQGVRNLNDGISLLNLADAAVEQLTSITVRLQELAAQSANGVLNHAQRNAIDQEAQALSQEYFRISSSTEFNGLNIFNGENPDLRFQAGYGEEGSISSSLGGAIGTGGFGSIASYTAQTVSCLSIDLGDINRDGFLDVVTSGQDEGNHGYAAVRLGDGAGGFGSEVRYAAEELTPQDVELSDVNGDGILDLITGGRELAAVARITVRLGDGSGSFGAAVSFVGAGSRYYDITTGDVNGDGLMDIVASGYESGVRGAAAVHLGDGHGSFTLAKSFAAEGAMSFGVQLADLNGDDILDMVTAGSDASYGYATVRLGDGAGSFGAAVSYDTQSYRSYDLALKDLNGDGVLDMITAGAEDGTTGAADVRLGLGDGRFGGATTYATEGSVSYGLQVTDINGDGALDMITGGQDGSSNGAVTIRLGDGSGGFSGASSFSSEDNRSNGVALGDLNGDGAPDLLTAGYTDSSDGYFSVRLAQTKDGISPLLPFSLQSQSDALQAMPVFDHALDMLSGVRGLIGAFQSRLNIATSAAEASVDNYLAAAGRITDVDVAEEAAQMVRLQILQQAGAAVLAQANQSASVVLSLLN